MLQVINIYNASILSISHKVPPPQRIKFDVDGNHKSLSFLAEIYGIYFFFLLFNPKLLQAKILLLLVMSIPFLILFFAECKKFSKYHMTIIIYFI